MNQNQVNEISWMLVCFACDFGLHHMRSMLLGLPQWNFRSWRRECGPPFGTCSLVAWSAWPREMFMVPPSKKSSCHNTEQNVRPIDDSFAKSSILPILIKRSAAFINGSACKSMWARPAVLQSLCYCHFSQMIPIWWKDTCVHAKILCNFSICPAKIWR